MAVLAMATSPLGGCNLVVTDQPLFSKADGAGGPRFRAGVWSGAPARLHVRRVKASKGLAEMRQRPVPGPRSATVVRRAGRPTDPADDRVAADRIYGFAQFYVGFQVIRSDAAGRVTEVRILPVQCDPPPPDGDKSGLTKHTMKAHWVRDPIPGDLPPDNNS
jgi:hypothetical protein